MELSELVQKYFLITVSETNGLGSVRESTYAIGQLPIMLGVYEVCCGLGDILQLNTLYTYRLNKSIQFKKKN